MYFAPMGLKLDTSLHDPPGSLHADLWSHEASSCRDRPRSQWCNCGFNAILACCRFRLDALLGLKLSTPIHDRPVSPYAEL